MIDPLERLFSLRASWLARRLVSSIENSTMFSDVVPDTKHLGANLVPYDQWRIKVQHLCWKFEVAHPGDSVSFFERLPRAPGFNDPISLGCHVKLNRNLSQRVLSSMSVYEIEYLIVLSRDVKVVAALAAGVYEQMSFVAQIQGPPLPPKPYPLGPYVGESKLRHKVHL